MLNRVDIDRKISQKPERALHSFGLLTQHDFVSTSKDFHFFALKAKFLWQPDSLTIS